MGGWQSTKTHYLIYGPYNMVVITLTSYNLIEIPNGYKYKQCTKFKNRR